MAAPASRGAASSVYDTATGGHTEDTQRSVLRAAQQPGDHRLPRRGRLILRITRKRDQVVNSKLCSYMCFMLCIRGFRGSRT